MAIISDANFSRLRVAKILAGQWLKVAKSGWLKVAKSGENFLQIFRTIEESINPSVVGLAPRPTTINM